jgi:hypothetical protein
MHEHSSQEFARLAMELFEQGDQTETVDVVVQFALRAVAADTASVVLIHARSGELEPVGTTDENAARADQLQVATGQGPCLDAVIEADSFLVRDSLTDQRWPRWCAAIRGDLGIRSVLSVRIGTTAEQIGALTSTRGDRTGSTLTTTRSPTCWLGTPRSRWPPTAPRPTSGTRSTPAS